MCKYLMSLRTLTLAVAAFALPSIGLAQADKNIRFVIPWPAGGNGDVVGRTVADKMGELMGQRFVIENRAGATGSIGMELASKAPPDGNTIAMVITANTVNVTLYPKLGFDLVKDFAPIGPIAVLPLVLVVNPSVPANSVKELIDLARAQPGKLNYATGGSGTVGHLAAELFKSMTKLQITHIPYKGSTPAATDLIGGQVQMFFDGTPLAMPHVKSGKLRVLAVTTAKRLAALPDVPTVAESLPGFEVTGWFGLMAPAGTDAKIVARYNTELNKAVASPEVQSRFAAMGLETLASTPQQFGILVQSEIAKWGKVVKEANIKVD